MILLSYKKVSLILFLRKCGKSVQREWTNVEFPFKQIVVKIYFKVLRNMEEFTNNTKMKRISLVVMTGQSTQTIGSINRRISSQEKDSDFSSRRFENGTPSKGGNSSRGRTHDCWDWGNFYIAESSVIKMYCYKSVEIINPTAWLIKPQFNA